MSAADVSFGVCPRCFAIIPLIWDGTIRPHRPADPDSTPTRLLAQCAGSLHAPVPEENHVHRCSCGVTFTEDTQ